MNKEMNIKGHTISQHTIESYLRACNYNQCTGTEASDKMQEDVHKEVFQELGIAPESPDYDAVVRAVDDLVHDSIIRGY